MDSSGRYIDLTFPIHEGMTTYPSHWHPIVEISILGRHGIENRETRKITLGTHTGTHCDAPLHFVPEGGTVDELPLDLMIGPATVIDLSHSRPRSEIAVSELAARIPGGKIPERLILRYDWSDRWGKMEYYTDYPFLSLEAAKWLAEGGVRLLAMDTPTPDNPEHGRNSELDSPNHKTFLQAGIVLVEYLCNLSSIKTREIELIVLPLKIKGGDGAPVRCVARETCA